MPSESKYERPKLSQNHLSALMRFILLNTGTGMQRGEIAEQYYDLERRYCGCYIDNCLHGKQKIHYERHYRRAQPAISKALKRLQKRGLIRLIRHGRNVKEVFLTIEGKEVKEQIQKQLSYEKNMLNNNNPPNYSSYGHYRRFKSLDPNMLASTGILFVTKFLGFVFQQFIITP